MPATSTLPTSRPIASANWTTWGASSGCSARAERSGIPSQLPSTAPATPTSVRRIVARVAACLPLCASSTGRKPGCTYNVALELSGSDNVELGSDGCTLFHTSEGDFVKRFDVCRNSQLPDFNPDTGASAFGTCSAHTPRCDAATYQERALPDGGMLVADGSFVVARLTSAGGPVIQSGGARQDNTTAEHFQRLGGPWYGLSLDPDGKAHLE